MLNFLKFLEKIILSGLIWLIRFYQKVWSPDHSFRKFLYPFGFCRHYPSCSVYCELSLLKFGLIKGLFFSFKRILRCNPWVKPSVDLPYSNVNESIKK